MKIFKCKNRFIILGELEKLFHVFSNSIDCEIIGQCGMSFEKSFKILLK